MTNKELVIGFFMEGYVHHNYDFLMENMATDYFDNSPCAARSNQECVDILKNTEKTFTDMEVEILDLIEEDNKVAIRARFTATHNAEVYDLQPTGKRISFEALEIFRIENGLIVESWGYWPDMSIKELLIKND
ncbi:MAG: ester cyclase [Lachnospiraceae bacterium]|nr:ester cyclase [Lachnospiraceae bacterium]